jgi:putative transposase
VQREKVDHSPPPTLTLVSGGVLVLNERHLRWIVAIYLHHFNAARPHRTLAQLAPAQAETNPPQVIDLASYQVRYRAILNGLTSEYQIAA